MKRIVLALLLSSIGLVAQATDPLAGAWEHTGGRNFTTNTDTQVSNPPLHVVYGNGHYIQFVAPANRQRVGKPLSQMTKEELTARFTGVQGHYGTYRVEGNKVIRKIVSAADPRNEGKEDIFEFRIDGDSLIMKGTTPIGEPIENRYKRLK